MAGPNRTAPTQRMEWTLEAALAEEAAALDPVHLFIRAHNDLELRAAELKEHHQAYDGLGLQGACLCPRLYPLLTCLHTPALLCPPKFHPSWSTPASCKHSKPPET